MSTIAFLGLGVMGGPMAGHLSDAGHEIKVWNRTETKADLWVRSNAGDAVSSIKDAVVASEYVMLCVGNDQDVKEVTDEVLKFVKPGTLIVDHTTASADCAREVYAKAKAHGVEFLDAPISGGEMGAVNGQLTIMCGGDLAAFKKAMPIMEPYAKAMKYMGESGAGQLTKMVNQICIAGTLQGLSEALNFALRVGLDVDEVVGAIGKGAAQSWQMDNRASTMAKDEFEFGFAVDWMRKDLGIAIAQAGKVGADVTLTKVIDGYYKEVQAMDGGRWDTSSLIRRLR